MLSKAWQGGFEGSGFRGDTVVLEGLAVSGLIGLVWPLAYQGLGLKKGSRLSRL